MGTAGLDNIGLDWSSYQDHYGLMTRVSVSQLKAHRSRYLREVRRGGEVEVLDRGVPVARLTRLSAAEPAGDGGRRQRLVHAGVLRPGNGNARAILDLALVEVPASIRDALEQERSDRL
jgi:prevent-host-death family protein